MPKKKVNFTTDDLSITSDGRVVISNPEVAKSFVNRLRAIDPGTAGIFDNCDCSGRAMDAVSLAGKLKARPLALDLDAGISPGTVGIFDNCSCG